MEKVKKKSKSKVLFARIFEEISGRIIEGTIEEDLLLYSSSPTRYLKKRKIFIKKSALAQNYASADFL